MESMSFYQVSSLEKVYLDYKVPEKEITYISGMKNERISYQIAYTGYIKFMRRKMKISVSSPLKDSITIRMVGNVPSEYPVSIDSDEHYERYSPGLFPDVLYPMEEECIDVKCSVWHSLWITVEPDGIFDKGIYPVDITFEDEEEKFTKHIDIEIIDAQLPEQELIFTQWLHTDCISDFYNLDVFSEKHWELIDKFIAVAVRNGINMILTPIFTPPLDTQIGGERTTVQLVDVKIDNGKYTFNFDKLRNWIAICKKNGVRYYEMAHLFTQWGAEATPKIIACVDGEEKRIFGWDVSSTSREYEEFLSEFLPALSDVLQKEQIDKNTFFHISDEPRPNHQERYLQLKNMVKKYLPGYTILDAMSDYSFYENGIADLAVVSNNHMEKFLENNVSNLWTYYCTSQSVDVSNRFMAMPSYRNRIIATQLYKFDVKGFLHWGYNYYNSELSVKKINPFVVTDSTNYFQSGDAFSVYPYTNGPIESLRIVVFTEALQDLRAFKLLEGYIGKAQTLKLIEDMAQMEIQFDKYPHSSEYLLSMREAVNKRIKEQIEFN